MSKADRIEQVKEAFGRLQEDSQARMTGLEKDQLPVILVGSDYWNGLVDWIKARLLADKRISPEDIDILQVIDDPAEVVRAVSKIVIL